MRTFLRRNWRVITPIGVVAAGLAAYLAFGVFAFQTALVDDKVDEAAPTFTAPPTTQTVEPGSETSVPPRPQTLASGEFERRSHPGKGSAIVLSDGGEQRVLRFQDFRTDNGPDLNVYLSSAPADAPANQFTDDFIDLGDLKGNSGPQNYEIPTSVDLSRHRTVVVWCVRFNVAFTVAALSLA